MKCKICGNEKISVVYNGKIRDGKLEHYTDSDVEIYKCDHCKVMWHEPIMNLEQYYESAEYRKSLEGSTDEETFYRLHDKETIEKFRYTGTEIYRNKVTADIGCGCGAFLDYINGVSSSVIAIEPSQFYRNVMDRKGFYTYPYAAEALKKWKNKVDVVTSFDVIEHVEKPQDFLKECKDLLKEGGTAIIGTPTDAPIMRALLGTIYEKKILFSTQHLWIFSEESLRTMAEETGFSYIEIKYYQRYGIANMLGWIKEKKPGTEIPDSAVSGVLDAVWKKDCEMHGNSDYFVLYAHK